MTPAQVKQLYLDSRPTPPVPVHQWKLDEIGAGPVIDTGSSPINGTNNGALINQDGFRGRSYIFSGAETISFGSSIDIPNGSISLWFKCTETGLSGIIGMGASTTDYADILIGGGITNSYADESLRWANVSNSSIVISAFTREGVDAYNDGIWHHLVVVMDGVSNSIYIDGVSKTLSYDAGSSVTANAFMSTNSNDGLFLGKRVYPGVPDYFNGNMRDVRLYNVGLSPRQVSDIYRGLA